MNREELTQYSDLLYKYLLKLCQDPDMAEELVQETYYQAFRSSKSFEGRCSISTWLCQIGKNIWYKELRKRKQDSKLLHLVSTGEISEQDTASAEDSYELRERYRGLLKRIHSLDTLAKEVVLLRLTGDLTFFRKYVIPCHCAGGLRGLHNFTSLNDLAGTEGLWARHRQKRADSVYTSGICTYLYSWDNLQRIRA